MTTTKPRVALFDFMPYGAPELLESERAHMSRALLASTLLLTLTCAVLALALPHLVLRAAPAADAPTEVTLFDVLLKRPPSIVPEPAMPAVPIARPSGARAGAVVPVDDRLAPTEDPGPHVTSGDGAGIGPAVSPGEGTGVGDLPAPPPEAVPLPDEFVPVDEMPVLVRRVIPVYPELARDAGVDGTVLVQALIGKDGHVLETRVQPGRSVPLLDAAALAAVKGWVFTPALQNRHPVLVWVRVPVVFRLH